MAAFEILVVTLELSSMIREVQVYRVSPSMQTGGGLGLCLLSDAFNKIPDKKKFLSGSRAVGIFYDPSVSHDGHPCAGRLA